MFTELTQMLKAMPFYFGFTSEDIRYQITELSSALLLAEALVIYSRDYYVSN